MPWGKFWRLLAQLSSSSDSRYSKALRNDPELAAAAAAEVGEDDPPWTPPLSDWTLLHELMQINNDRLGQVASLIADLPTNVRQRHTPPAPLPRPETELSKALTAARAAAAHAYDNKIMDFAEKAKARYKAMSLEERAAVTGRG